MDRSRGTMIRRLAPGEIRVFSAMAGVEVRCLEGRIWLTQYGDDRDVVLEAGRACVPAMASAVVVMSSAHGARVALGRPERSARVRRRWWQRLASVFDPRAGSAVLRQLEGRVPTQVVAPEAPSLVVPVAVGRGQRPVSRAFFSSYSRIRSS